MKNYSKVTVRLPEQYTRLLDDLRDCDLTFRSAYQACEQHAITITEEMSRAIEMNDHEFKPLVDHETIGQELCDEMEAKKRDLLNKAQELAEAWRALDIPF